MFWLAPLMCIVVMLTWTKYEIMGSGIEIQKASCPSFCHRSNTIILKIHQKCSLKAQHFTEQLEPI